MDNTGMIHRAFRIIVDPMGVFRSVKGEGGFRKPIRFLLVFGWVTAILSGVLSLYGVDYTNPSNVGGSAQLLAPWILMYFEDGFSGASWVAAFAILIMIGYLVLTAISIPVLALITWTMKGRRQSLNSSLSGSAKAILYGMTPGFLFGWVPNPLYLVGLWATLWQALAVKEILELSWVKTVVIVLCWIIIVGVIHDAASYLWGLI